VARAGNQRTYRSREQAVGIWIAVVLGLAWFAGIAIDAVGEDHAVVAFAMGGLIGTPVFWLAIRSARAGVRVDDEGAHIMNVVRTIHVPWHEIVRFSIGSHGMLPKTGIVDLRGGERIAIWGIQAPNPVTRPKNRSAERLIEALNAELERHRPVARTDPPTGLSVHPTPSWAGAGGPEHPRAGPPA